MKSYRIPGPDINIGSSEVKAVASALQNRIISDLINSALIRPLSKISGKSEIDREAVDIEFMSKNITANDLLPILVAIANGRFCHTCSFRFLLVILELSHIVTN